jgi:hypothetical protein
MDNNDSHKNSNKDFDKSLGKKKQTLDAQVKAALENLEVSYNAEHWAAFETRLEALDKSEADFDSDLRSKLGTRTPVRYNAEHWAAFEARLEALDKSEADFDSDLRSKLSSRTSVRYNAEHWAAMSQKIDRELTLRGKILRFKLMEVAAMLFFIFSIFSYLDVQNSTGRGGFLDKILPLTPQNAPSKAKGVQDAEINKTFEGGTKWRERAPQNRSKNVLQPSGFEQKAVGVPLVYAPATDFMPIVSISTPEVGSGNGGNKPINIASAAALTVASIENENPDDLLRRTDIAELTNLELPTTTALATNNSDIVHVALPQFRQSRWRVSLFGNTTLDKVRVNFIRNRVDAFTSQTVPSLGLGTALAYLNKKWEFETGANYQVKNYDLPIVEKGSFYRSYVVEDRSLRLSIVGLTAGANYTVAQTPKWRFFARVASSFNAILNLKEIVSEQHSDIVPFSAPPGNPTGPESENELAAYNPGFFRSAASLQKQRVVSLSEAPTSYSIKDNSYFTAQAGLGVEYRISNRHAAFVQASYERHLGVKGIGSFNDKINSVNLQAGLKTQISKNY